MSHFPHGAIIAAQAAQEEQRKRKEEETMTNYTNEDLEQNWEFKIVRASGPAFHRPEIFQALLEEEALSGWEMVEKLDDQRVRFKRRRELRRKDAALPPGIDPYRTQYGANPNVKTVTALVLAGVLMMLGLGFALFLGAPLSGDPPESIGWIAPLIVVLVGVTVGALAAIRRR